MTGQLRAWAAALGGVVSGGQVLAPGPGHSSRDRSLSVTPSATAPDGFVVHSFANDDPLVCKDYVRRRLGLSSYLLGQKRNAAPHRKRKPVEEKPASNREPALRLWGQSCEPRGTLVEAYLRNRRLELPDEAANEAIRFHPDCPFGPERYPAMIALIRNIETDKPQAIQRTALLPDGTAVKRNGKIFRMSLGPMAGGAIKIDPDEDVTQYLCIGEGVETCLSGRQMELRPVWSVVNTSGVAKFPILPEIADLAIIRENDSASAKAVEACARRWFDGGREVVIVTSELGSDLNDELLGPVQ